MIAKIKMDSWVSYNEYKRTDSFWKLVGERERIKHSFVFHLYSIWQVVDEKKVFFKKWFR